MDYPEQSPERLPRGQRKVPSIFGYPLVPLAIGICVGVPVGILLLPWRPAIDAAAIGIMVGAIASFLVDRYRWQAAPQPNDEPERPFILMRILLRIQREVNKFGMAVLKGLPWIIPFNFLILYWDAGLARSLIGALVIGFVIRLGIDRYTEYVEPLPGDQWEHPPSLVGSIRRDIEIVLKRLGLFPVVFMTITLIAFVCPPWWPLWSRWLLKLAAVLVIVFFSKMTERYRPPAQEQPFDLRQLPGQVRSWLYVLMALVLLVIFGGSAYLEYRLDSLVLWPYNAALVQVVGGVVGLWIVWNMRRGAALAESALDRLNRGEPIGELPARGFGPLNPLLARINSLGADERQIGVLRSQWLRQVDEIAIQEERKRLARDLHDSIKQQLFAINVSAAAAQARWERDPAGARAALEDVRRSAREGMVEMQALLQELRPVALETVGLVEALREQCEALGYRSGARMITKFGDLPAEESLPPGVQEALFRIAQEALSNIARHARAEHVLVKLAEQDNALLLEVRDDGQGFEPGRNAGGMGLANMRERAEVLGGSMELTSTPDRGTTVRVSVPLVASVLLQEERDDLAIEAWEQQANSAYFVRAIAAGASMILLLLVGRFFLAGGLLPIIWLLVLGVVISLAGAIDQHVRMRQALTQIVLSAGSESAIVSKQRYTSLRWNVVFNGLYACVSYSVLIDSNETGLLRSLIGGWDTGLPSFPQLGFVIGMFFSGLALIELWRSSRAARRYFLHLTPRALQSMIGPDANIDLHFFWNLLIRCIIILVALWLLFYFFADHPWPGRDERMGWGLFSLNFAFFWIQQVIAIWQASGRLATLRMEAPQ